MFLLYALYHIFDKKLQHLCYFLVYYLNHLLFKLALSVHLKVWKVHLKVWKVHLKITIVLNVILDPLKLKKYFVIFYTTGNLS